MPRKSTKTVSAAGKEKAADKKVSENLRKIYENPDGSMPDMSTIDRKRSGQIWRALVSLLVFGGIIVLGFWAWNTQINPRLAFENELAVDLTGPTLVAPGSTSEYTVRYRNPGDSDIETATLYFEHPSGFIITSSSKPLSEDKQKIALGSLGGNESGEVKVQGIWAVDYSTTSTLGALLSYTPVNFSSVFEKKNSIEVAANQSALQFMWSAPAASSVGKQTTVSVTVKFALPFAENTRLQLNVPNDFSVASTEPKSDELGGYEWKLPTSTNSFTVNAKGAFNASSSQAFSATVRGFVSTTQVILGKSTQTASATPVNESSVQVTVLDKSDTVVAAPGTNLPIKISVTNPGTAPITNGVIVLNIAAPSSQNKSILNWEKFADEYDGTIKGQQLSPELRRGLITWTEAEIKQLANLAPGATVPITVSIPIKNSDEATLSNFVSSTIMVTAELRSGTSLVATSEPVIVSIISDTQLSRTVALSNTTYAVKWVVINSFHELKDVRVEGDLYGDFTWDQSSASVPAGSIHFDSKTKKLVWTIPKLPTNLDVAELKFNMPFAKLNPTQKDLSSVITLTATDAETGDTITLSVPAIKAQ